jgi:hypothetical protein
MQLGLHARCLQHVVSDGRQDVPNQRAAFSLATMHAGGCVSSKKPAWPARPHEELRTLHWQLKLGGRCDLVELVNHLEVGCLKLRQLSREVQSVALVIDNLHGDRL